MHDALKNNVKSLVWEAFKVRGAKHLIMDTHGKAHLSQNPAESVSCVSVDRSVLVEWTDYLIDNVYIRVGNKVYQQTIGIPMGTDCASQLANMLFVYYEYTYMEGLMGKDMYMARRLTTLLGTLMTYLHLTISNLKMKYQ